MKGMNASQYLDHARQFLSKKLYAKALSLLKEGVEAHPGNPFLLSYYGAMLAATGRDVKKGVRMTELALKQLSGAVPVNRESHYPLFYLNIGRAYLAAGDRRKAMFAFRKGLQYDRYDPDLSMEMISLGVRRKPPFPSLRRAHPLNRYVGLILHKLGK